MLGWLETRTRAQKGAILILADTAIMPMAGLAALAIQLGAAQAWPAAVAASAILPLLMVLSGAFSIALGIPRIKLDSFEFGAIGQTAVFSLFVAATAASLGTLAELDLQAGAYVAFGLLFFLMSASSRVIMRAILRWLQQRTSPRIPVLIYGAGTTGVQLATALKSHETIVPVIFADDNPSLQGLTIAGLSVIHPSRVGSVAAARGITRVLLAMPSVSRPKQAQIAAGLQRQGLEVQTLPSFAQLIGEEALVAKLTPVSPSLLLGRAPHHGEMKLEHSAYAGKSVLISGAGGSIGSELCRQILALRPRMMVLFELSELALYTIDMELQTLAAGSDTVIVPILGSVTDRRQVRRVIADHGVDVVLHAAAYKHVPLVEANPIAGLANNVFGTRTLAQAAAEAGLDRFILISSDKAVRPANVMGASKRLSELIVQDLSTRSKRTVFTMVRFGNVLGSSGSVIPLFQSQIAQGGPVTLTHDDITRYFMTIEEAVRLVLLAGTFANGGEVFVLDMGAPVAIRDLARQTIEASGYTVRDATNPKGDIEIVTTGLRPGEKLHEELSIGAGLVTTDHPKILSTQESVLSEIEVAAALRGLQGAIAAGDAHAARALLARWVEGYGPQANGRLGADDGA